MGFIIVAKLINVTIYCHFSVLNLDRVLNHEVQSFFAVTNILPASRNLPTLILSRMNEVNVCNAVKASFQDPRKRARIRATKILDLRRP